MVKKLILLLVILIGMAVACSSENGPEQIAIHSMEEPVAIYPRFPENRVVYNATFDIEVLNVERVTERAKEIAFEQGGYLVSAQSWYRDGEKHTTVVLAVPAQRFDPTRDDILRLGTLAGEWISSEIINTVKEMPDAYSQITIYFHPKESILPDFSLPKWRPVRTFEKAWSVFISIFGFLFDIVIWVTVVAGPFVVIGLVSRKLFQWWQRK